MTDEEFLNEVQALGRRYLGRGGEGSVSYHLSKILVELFDRHRDLEERVAALDGKTP